MQLTFLFLHSISQIFTLKIHTTLGLIQGFSIFLAHVFLGIFNAAITDSLFLFMMSYPISLLIKSTKVNYISLIIESCEITSNILA